MLSEKGSISDTPVMKLLLTVFEQGLTGILYIKREDILKVLYFSRGKIVWAISNSDADKLENILVEKGLSDSDTIRKVKMESRVSESIGKLLVEKGLITLEELIEATKEQLKHIMISVMKWKAGGFQFIKDAPPERLLSLDLNVTDFIIQFILEEIDVSDIWKEIGTLQLELIKNPDPEKLAKYKLSDKQRELLNSFDGEKKLESILSRHSGGHRESLLKIIYFFMMAELLIKKEFDLSNSALYENGAVNESPFDTYNDLDLEKPLSNSAGQLPDMSGASGVAVPAVSKAESTLEPSIKQSPPSPSTSKPLGATDSNSGSSKQKDADPFDLPTMDQFESQRKTEVESLRTVREEIPAISHTPPAFIANAESQDSKKRLKLFNWVLISVFVILVFGGIILLLLPLMESEPPTGDLVKKQETPDIITIQEPETKTDGTGVAGDTAQDAAEQSIPSATKKEDLSTDQTKKPGEKPAPDTKGENSKEKQPTETKKPDQKPAEVKEKTPQKQIVSGKSPLEYFDEGNYITAGDLWKSELVANKIKFSIMLELDCQKESVAHAYKMVNNSKNFFILNRKAGRKNCFLVLFGKFKTYENATASIRQVPNYFWKQSDPPEIVELEKYLR